MQRVWSIQYLRAVAALMVVVFHALEATNTPFSVGAAGVDIFFVISGFIMASLLLGEQNSAGSFMWRRLIRIAPLYWAATFAALAIYWVKPGFFFRFDPSLENTLLSLAFIPHEARGDAVAPVLWQGWTLEYEMFFYAICAFALFMPAQNRLKAICGVLGVLIVFGLLAPAGGAAGRVYTNTLLLEFVAGIALAAAWRRNTMAPPLVGLAALLVGAALYALDGFGAGLSTGWRFLDWGAPAFLIVGGVLSLEAAGRVKQSRAGALLGDASYSIYLTHGFVVAAFVWFFSDAPLAVRLAACVLGSVAVALASYLWFERPMTQVLKGLSGAVKRRAPA